MEVKDEHQEKYEIACLNVQSCNYPAKRECVRRFFEERGLVVLVLSEMKLIGMGEWTFELVVGRVSGVSSGRAKEEFLRVFHITLFKFLQFLSWLR